VIEQLKALFRFGRNALRRPVPTRPSCNLRVEELEGREVPATGLTPFGSASVGFGTPTPVIGLPTTSPTPTPVMPQPTPAGVFTPTVVVNLNPFSATTGVFTPTFTTTFPTLLGSSALGAFLGPNLQGSNIFVGGLSVQTPAGKLALERLVIGEMTRANVANILLGSLAVQRGTTQQVRDIGSQLVQLGVAGLTVLRPLLQPFGIQVNFTTSDIRTLRTLGVQPGSLFDQQFANLLNSLNQRLATAQTFFFVF
jgi:hypothetical protein